MSFRARFEHRRHRQAAAARPCGSLVSHRRQAAARPALPPVVLAAGELQEEKREGPAMDCGRRSGDERGRDVAWDPHGSVGELNEWIARLLEGTTK